MSSPNTSHPAPIAPPQPSPASVTSTTAQGSTVPTMSSTSVTTTSKTPAPPSISDSTATGTTATTSTGGGASSTSSPPPPLLFPPLANHHHHHQQQQPAPPQLSTANALPHHHQHHGPPPLPQGYPAAGGPGPSHPPSSSLPHHPQHHPPQQQQQQQPPPIPSTPSQIESARRAVVATLGNLVDRELSGRAAQLHSNNAAIERQERELARTLESFRKDNDKLARLAADNARKIKEIGNVQNWAEMLEREFLIVEETLRLVRRRRGGDEEGEGGDGEGSEGSWSGSGSVCSRESCEGCGRDGGGSDDGDGDEGEREEDRSGEGGMNGAVAVRKGKERQGDVDGDGDVVMGTDGGPHPVLKGPATTVDKGKGKDVEEQDIASALAEAMETDLVVAEQEPGYYEESQEQEQDGNHGLPIPEQVALPASPARSSILLGQQGPSIVSVGT